MKLQKIFKENYVRELREGVLSGESIPLYKENVFSIDEKQVRMLRNVYAPSFNLCEKLTKIYTDDFQAAVAVYEAYKDISPLLASSEAFWAYLTHVDLYEYTKLRWPKVNRENTSPNYIIDHWFIGGKGIYRNAIASLWWGIYNTILPENENPYELSKVLFSSYGFRVTAFGASPIIRHREAMIGILSFIKDNPEMRYKTKIGGEYISKYFNRLGAVKQLTYMDRDYFRDVCEQLKEKILSINKIEQLQDETLFTDI